MIDSTLWYTCDISIHGILKNRKKKEKKKCSLQILGTRETLQNILKN